MSDRFRVTRVLVVDDHPLVRQGVCGYLSLHDDIVVVGEAGSGEEAYRRALEVFPDVILLDIVLPDGESFDSARQIMKDLPDARIVMLSSYHEDRHIRLATEIGVTGFLLKDIEADELVGAVRKAARGESVLCSRIVSQLMRELANAQARSSRSQDSPVHRRAEDSLSQREREILRLIAKGFSNATIASSLVISEKTVKTHVSNILAKLDLADRTQAAAFAWENRLVEP